MDDLTLRSCGTIDDFAFSRVDNLNKGLSPWFRREYLKMTDIMKLKIKEGGSLTEQ